MTSKEPENSGALFCSQIQLDHPHILPPTPSAALNSDLNPNRCSQLDLDNTILKRKYFGSTFGPFLTEENKTTLKV
jgi:hypothetical protein